MLLRLVRLLCTMAVLFAAMQFLVLPLTAAAAGLVVAVFTPFVAALLGFCAISVVVVPVLIFGKTVLRKFPSLQKRLGTIWMSGALIGSCMFCLGVCYKHAASVTGFAVSAV